MTSAPIRETLKHQLAAKPLLLAWLYDIKRAITPRTNVDLSSFCRLVNSGDIVFDIGANHGMYTTLLSRMVGKDGRVHAFEPVPATADRLAANVARWQRVPNVLLNRVGLSDKTADITFYLPAGESQLASSRRHEDVRWDASEVVDIQCSVIPGDEYVQVHQVPRLDFVKCDTEGAELLVIRGMRETLRNLRPVLFLESYEQWTKSYGYTAGDLVQVLQELGYDRFLVVHVGGCWLVDAAAVESEANKIGSAVNLIVADSARHSDRLRRLRVARR